MLHVPAPSVEVIRVTLANDEPLFDGVDDDGKPKARTQGYVEWLLARTTDEEFAKFGGEKKGVDLIELLQLARMQIKACRGKTGVHSFDDEVAKRLQQAILHPSEGRLSPAPYEHNWIGWVLNWKKLYPEIPAVLEVASP